MNDDISMCLCRSSYFYLKEQHEFTIVFVSIRNKKQITTLS